MNLLKAASTVSLWTLLSRITGLMREQLVAASFGASAWTDAYNVAFRIPNLLRRLFAEGAFSQAFVPLLASTRAAEGDEVTHRLIDAVATVLMWALVATCIVGVAGAPAVVWAMASGLERFDDATLMTRIMFPYIGFMSMVALAAGILNTWRNFSVPAATPVLLNVAVIAAARWLTPTLVAHGIPGIYSLAVGVMAGGLLQAGVQVPALRRRGLLPRIAFTPSGIAAAWHHPGVRRVLKQMSPALLGVSVAQLSLLMNTQIASHLATGSVSYLTYADRLMEFPIALLGVALGVVLIPQLSAAQARQDAEAFSGLIDWGLRLLLLLALPCALALLVFAGPLVAVLFHYGHFRDVDVASTIMPLRGYGLGLMGLVGVKVLAPGYFARLDIRTPVKIAIVVLVATQLMNVVFVPWLGVGGLALSIGLGALFNAGWLFAGLVHRGTYRPLPGWGAFTARVGLATAVLGGALWWAGHAIDWIGLRAHTWERVGLMAAVLTGVALLYFGVLAATGLNLRAFARRG